jgi:hypothetical protein
MRRGSRKRSEISYDTVNTATAGATRARLIRNEVVKGEGRVPSRDISAVPGLRTHPQHPMAHEAHPLLLWERDFDRRCGRGRERLTDTRSGRLGGAVAQLPDEMGRTGVLAAARLVREGVTPAIAIASTGEPPRPRRGRRSSSIPWLSCAERHRTRFPSEGILHRRVTTRT